MKLIYWWPALCLVLICVSVFAICGQSVEQSNVDLHHSDQLAQPEPKQAELSPRQRFQLPKIFDFELYKRLFKRAYHGLEETVRRKFMLARAFRAWISSLKYKYRKSSYYLALNHLSDKSPEELERMENHQLNDDDDDDVKRVEASGIDVDDEHQRQSIPEVDPNHIEENLNKLTSGQGEQIEGLQELQDELMKQEQSSRRKRDVATRKSRDFDIDRLISTGDDVTLAPETARKVQWKPASNNPSYVAPEVTSFGLRDDSIEDMSWFELNLPPEMQESPMAGVYSFFGSLTGLLKGVGGDSSSSTSGPASGPKNLQRDKSKPASGWTLSGEYIDGVSEEHQQQEEDDDDDELPDEVFVDLRDSNCMFLPRAQGKCGACYAFVAITIAEYIHCRETGKLVAFSEQYLVDCGKPHLMGGCDGGNKRNTAKFIHNYGLELRVNYPYRQREDECPYEPHTDPKSMGYIRMDLGAGAVVPEKLFERHIEMSPMVLGISTKNAFHEYGGGVADGSGCQPKSTHAVLLIGHGREDGQEYWLIRNSYGVGWGERGHYKLAKSSQCIPEHFAIMYGTQNAKEFVFRMKENRRNNQQIVKTHYSKKLVESMENKSGDI